MIDLIDEIHANVYTIVVYQCECGFHIGFDLTYLDQVGNIKIPCPACARLMDTTGSDPNIK